MKTTHRMTREEEKFLTDSLEKGVPVREIARQMGRNAGAVRMKARRMGLKLPGMNLVTDEAVSKIVEMFKAGSTDQQIADALGYGHSTVRNVRLRMDLRRKTTSKPETVTQQSSFDDTRKRLLCGAWV